MHVSAAWAAQNQRRRRSPQIVRFRDHVADLVHGAGDEVHKLKLSNRAHACERCAKCRTDDGRLGDRRVDHAFRAEVINEAVGDFESPAIDSDVLTNAEDSGVALHFFPYTLANRFQICQLRHDPESVLRSKGGICRAGRRPSDEERCPFATGL